VIRSLFAAIFVASAIVGTAEVRASSTIGVCVITVIAQSSITEVSQIGSWTTGLTHTAAPGSNRSLIFIAHVEQSEDINLISVTYGGQTMTNVIDRIVSSSNNTRAYVVAYILNEAGVAAATSSTFVPNWDVTPIVVAYASAFLEDVNQSALVGAMDSNSVTDTSGIVTLTTSSLSTNDGDMVILAGTCGNIGTYTENNGFTEAIEQAMDSTATGIVGYKSATGADETPSVTHDDTNRQVLIGLVVQTNLTYQLTGTITSGSLEVNDVNLIGLGVVTDTNGFYSVTVDYGWSGTVIPSKYGYTFDPNSRIYTSVTSDLTAEDYNALPADDFNDNRRGSMWRRSR